MTQITDADILAILSGSPVAKDATAGDVHVSSADDDKAAAVVEGKTRAPVEEKPTSEAEIEKALQVTISKADPVFYKGMANLYVKRPLKEESAKRLVEWCAAQGIKNIVPAELMHVTQAHSTAEVDTTKVTPLSTLLDMDVDSRWLSGLGKGNGLVMFFRSPEMSARFKEFAAAGASWDFPSYIPHVTLSYDTGEMQPQEYGFNPPPDMPLLLGPEEFDRSNDKLTKSADGSFELTFPIQKVNADKQIIGGWASIATVNGIEITDKQDDQIPIDELEKGFHEYVLYGRDHGNMHERIGTGRLIACMTFTREKAALGLIAKNANGDVLEGAWVEYLITDAATWADIKSGKLSELSIGGKATPVPT